MFCVLLLCGGLAAAQEPLRSGPQPRDEIVSAFRPLNINGEFANEPHCLVCDNGQNPVVMLFARDLDEPLRKLIARLEAAAAKHRKQELGTFVVFLKDSETFRKSLDDVCQAQRFQHMILSIEDPSELKTYKLADDADLTVVLYSDLIVRANHAYKRGELNDRAIETIVADLAKILPTK